MDNEPDVDEAMRYLTTGGLGEVIGMTSWSLSDGVRKVQMDTDMAMALCLLASEALEARASAKLN